MPRLLLVAACALIDQDKRVLIAQRPPGKPMAGLWEFPGGKIEEGETPEDTVIREMLEELSVKVTKPCLAPLSFTSSQLSGISYLNATLYMQEVGRSSRSP